jgi:hypothetical protein
MEEAAHTGKALHGRTQTGKTLELINMVEKRRAEFSGAVGVLLPRPGNDLLEVC